MDLPPRHIVTEHGEADLTLQVYAEADERVICGVLQLTGKVNLPPKAWVRFMRDELAKLEQVARNAGCKELRMAGRRWSRIFPDYSPLEGKTNGIRKVLG